jgi:hypothetical protein
MDRGVAEVMDDVINRMYETVSAEKFSSIDDKFILNFLRPEEKKILSTKYQYFEVNVPVVVSLMRHVEQKVIPFWLPESGFVKTRMRVTNDAGYEYEVWQKYYPAGKVELGINGFDKHRPVYFITVGPQNRSDELMIANVYPSQYEVMEMKKGAFTYHDWSDLVLTEVPKQIAGHKLFTTVRGRAREAHIIEGFRSTLYPSSSKPDQVMLTWSNSPKTSVDIQWRTNTSVSDGAVRYWHQSSDTTLLTGSHSVIMDRMLFNDPRVHRFTAQLRELSAGTQYYYQVGSPSSGDWTSPEMFATEDSISDQCSFIWFGDTHCFPDSGKLISSARSKHPDVAFYSIAGDIVSTGLNRDDWDKFFKHSRNVFARFPLMPVPGNHDRQDGLGAQMYYDLFSLPQNGPKNVAAESSYAFEYGNALFLMIDATSDVAEHTDWIEQQLASSKATWKFAMFHFPPYNFEEPYTDIQQAWVPLFDKYHVDMVMGGHIHYYMRSNPMKAGKVVNSFDEGTVYTISISIPNKHDGMKEERYAVRQYDQGYFYQKVDTRGESLEYTAIDSNGEVKDHFVINKNRQHQ